MKVAYVMFDITEVCNFKCNHCYKNIQNYSGTELDATTIVNFIKTIDGLGQIAKIILSGGEPLLYSSLFELLDSIADDHSVQINTNAFFLDEHIDQLLKYKNLRLQVSLDGYDETTFFDMRNNYCFHKVLENAKLAKKKGLDVFFRTTLSSKTIKDSLKFVEISENTGIPLLLRPIINTGKESQNPLAIDYRSLIEWYHSCKEEGIIKYVGENLVSPHCSLLNKNMVISTLVVETNGDVYPCLLLKGEPFIMGNILRNDFNEILNNGVNVKNKVLKVLNNSKCVKCGFRKQFGDGTCVIGCFLDNGKCAQEMLQSV